MKFLIKIFILFLFLTPTTAWGSFGITPPYVKNSNLQPGDTHEQRIFIVQRDPAQDLSVELSWDVPGADEWISIDKGSEFVIPAGEQKFPIFVSVNVPEDAFSGEYIGNLKIVVYHEDQEESSRSGMIGVGMGANAKVELTVSGGLERVADATGLLASIPKNKIPVTAGSILLLFISFVLFVYKPRALRVK